MIQYSDICIHCPYTMNTSIQHERKENSIWRQKSGRAGNNAVHWVQKVGGRLPPSTPTPCPIGSAANAVSAKFVTVIYLNLNKK